LGTGAIAIEAFQIAAVGHIDFDVTVADLKRLSKTVNRKPLTSDELNRIENQSLERYISVDLFIRHDLSAFVH
jgi:hypothetical protein